MVQKGNLFSQVLTQSSAFHYEMFLFPISICNFSPSSINFYEWLLNFDFLDPKIPIDSTYSSLKIKNWNLRNFLLYCNAQKFALRPDTIINNDIYFIERESVRNGLWRERRKRSRFDKRWVFWQDASSLKDVLSHREHCWFMS